MTRQHNRALALRLAHRVFLIGILLVGKTGVKLSPLTQKIKTEPEEIKRNIEAPKQIQMSHTHHDNDNHNDNNDNNDNDSHTATIIHQELFSDPQRDDLTFLILSFLPIHDIIHHLSLVNHRFFSLAYSPTIFRHDRTFHLETWIEPFYYGGGIEGRIQRNKHLQQLFADISKISYDESDDFLRPPTEKYTLQFVEKLEHSIEHVNLTVQAPHANYNNSFDYSYHSSQRLNNEAFSIRLLKWLTASNELMDQRLKSFHLTVYNEQRPVFYPLVHQLLQRARHLESLALQMVNLEGQLIPNSSLFQSLSLLSPRLKCLHLKTVSSRELNLCHVIQICDSCTQLQEIGFNLFDFITFDWLGRLQCLKVVELDVEYSSDAVLSQVGDVSQFLRPLSVVPKLNIQVSGSHKFFSLLLSRHYRGDSQSEHPEHPDVVQFDNLRYLCMSSPNGVVDLHQSTQIGRLRALRIETKSVKNNSFQLFRHLGHSLRFLTVTGLTATDDAAANFVTMPHELSQLTKLTHLTVVGSELGHIPHGIFSQLKHLTCVDLSYNNLRQLPFNELELLPHLKLVDVTHNALQSIDTDLMRWPSLQYFIAKNNAIMQFPINMISLVLRGTVVELVDNVSDPLVIVSPSVYMTEHPMFCHQRFSEHELQESLQQFYREGGFVPHRLRIVDVKMEHYCMEDESSPSSSSSSSSPSSSSSSSTSSSNLALIVYFVYRYPPPDRAVSIHLDQYLAVMDVHSKKIIRDMRCSSSPLEEWLT